MMLARRERVMLSDSMENYLKVIYEIQERCGRATTSSIAQRMEIASPSVTAMVKRLAEINLVTHEPYQGVKLTSVGKRTALEVIRHHRLLELYLAEALGVPWDRVHEEAEKLEHVISEDLEDRIAAALGNPTVDPHGAPIPARDGTFERVEAVPLVEVTAGTRVVVIEVEDRDSDLLRYLGDLSLYPGTTIDVKRVEPYDGPMVLAVEDREIIIGRAAAAEIRVAAH
jgi:DtxR family Mn-dependent transcriptional regulator